MCAAPVGLALALSLMGCAKASPGALEVGAPASEPPASETVGGVSSTAPTSTTMKTEIATTTATSEPPLPTGPVESIPLPKPGEIPAGKVGSNNTHPPYTGPAVGTEEFIAQLAAKAARQDAQPNTAARVSRDGITISIAQYRPTAGATVTEADEEKMLDEYEDDLARKRSGEG